MPDALATADASSSRSWSRLSMGKKPRREYPTVVRMIAPTPQRKVYGETRNEKIRFLDTPISVDNEGILFSYYGTTIDLAIVAQK